MFSLQDAYFALYFIVPFAGIALNGYVLTRLIKLARKSAVRFETTSGLPLAAMSVGDSITLFTLLVQAIFHRTPKKNAPEFLLSATCKLDLYLMHTTSAFSVWCWLVLSLLRYTAVFHPIRYRTIWRQPRNALKTLAVFCFFFESWILFFVVYRSEENTCAESDNVMQNYVNFAHMSDIIVFYAIPSILRILFDFLVLVHCYAPFSMDGIDRAIFDRRCAISGPPLRRTSTSTDCEVLDKQNIAIAVSIATNTSQAATKKRATYFKKKTAMVMRSIVISVLNLLLNLPAHILRAWATLDDKSLAIDLVRNLEPIAQILYFSQFACNAFYLATSIYETSGTPRSTVVRSNARFVSRCISDDDAFQCDKVVL